jgi:tetratricopeptide (TPR) repeat protein
MDHPNIARVLDAGATASGRPYFVMELVRGVPITQFCDENRLKPRARLELFIPVCQAVQHAHQKGIIHRDLKPSNVLVTLHDGVPVAKVIDFGVAKAVGQQLTDKTVYTRFTQMIGTPLYMSPEQAELSGLDIDTRTDVYALGVLLYELLTGTTPFDEERLRTAGFDEMRRIIREEEPPRPSTRISTLGQAAATVSENRKSDPRRLSQLCRGELDWIVMKALEKDRNRRYESASAFAADVQRYLHDEPVQACPPSAWYRFRKFARRNKAALVIASVVVLAGLLAVTGLIVNNWLVTREKQRADRNLVRARDAVKKYLTLISQDPDLKAKGLEPLRQKLLATAREYYAEFVREHGGDPALRAEFADIRMLLASITEEIADKGEAIEEYQQALTLCQQLVDAQPTVAAYQRLLARCHGSLGRLYQSVGRFQDAEVALLKALAQLEELERGEPAVVQYRKDLATTHNSLGILYGSTGRFKEGETAYRKAAEIWQQLGRQHPAEAEYQSSFASAQNNLGALYEDMGRPEDAETAYQNGLAVRRQLVQAHPGATDYQDGLAQSLLNLGLLYSETQRPEQAEAASLEARSIWQKLADVHPTVMDYQHGLAAGHNNLALVYEDTKRPAEAQAAHRKALAIRQRLAAAHPTVLKFAVELGGSQCNLGNLTDAAGKHVEALDWYSQAVATLEGVLRREERHPTARAFLANTHFGRGQALRSLGRPAEAVTAYSDVLRLQPDNAQAHCHLGLALQAQQQFGEALASLKRGHELGSKNPHWRSPSAQWVRDCETLLGFDTKLAAILRGAAPPIDPTERVGLAEFCITYKQLPLTSLRLWMGVFADDVPRTEDIKAIHKYNAARAAALAGGGQGRDVARLSDKEHAQWRKQALDWLRAALDTWTERVEKGKPADCVAIQKQMERWQQAQELASLRDEAALAKLPEAEQAPCRKLWADVAALHARARARSGTPEPGPSAGKE